MYQLMHFNLLDKTLKIYLQRLDLQQSLNWNSSSLKYKILRKFHLKKKLVQAASPSSHKMSVA